MKITALEEYGLRCLLRVAEQPDGNAVSAAEIADREGLSLSYTQKIMRVLSKGDLVDSKRGAQGGYVLVGSPENVTIGDAIRVLGGMFEVEDICERHTGELDECANRCNCGIRPVWAHISEFVVETLDGISLAALMNDDNEVARLLDERLSDSTQQTESLSTRQ